MSYVQAKMLLLLFQSASSRFIEPSINIQSGINNGSGEISVDVYSPGLIEDNQEYIYFQMER